MKVHVVLLSEVWPTPWTPWFIPFNLVQLQVREKFLHATSCRLQPSFSCVDAPIRAWRGLCCQQTPGSYSHTQTSALEQHVHSRAFTRGRRESRETPSTENSKRLRLSFLSPPAESMESARRSNCRQIERLELGRSRTSLPLTTTNFARAIFFSDIDAAGACEPWIVIAESWVDASVDAAAKGVKNAMRKRNIANFELSLIHIGTVEVPSIIYDGTLSMLSNSTKTVLQWGVDLATWSLVISRRWRCIMLHWVWTEVATKLRCLSRPTRESTWSVTRLAGRQGATVGHWLWENTVVACAHLATKCKPTTRFVTNLALWCMGK